MRYILKLLKSHQLMTFIVYGGAAALLCGAIWYAYQYVEPLPPNKVTIAAGSKTGAYYHYARLYAEEFAKEGFELEIVETKGSMDNLARISNGSGKVDAAFMQGGIAKPDEYPDLRSLGSLYYEPLWVFYNHKVRVENLTDLKGKRVAIGPEGSGTNFLIHRILEENGILPENASLIDAPYNKVVPELREGKIDVMFFIAGANSEVIRTLSQPGSNVRLLSFHRAEAYARSHRYLKRLDLPQGGINLAEDQPSRDVDMLAPTANLVVRDDLHPALKFLFLLAARKIHTDGDIFAQPGRFPNDQALLFPLTKEAKSFYKSGPPLLMRYLPYQVAIMAERLKILLIPLLTLLYPLFKVTPPAYRWQIRRRIFKWYKYLKMLDMEAYEVTTEKGRGDVLRRLEEMDRQVLETSVPVSYTDAIYSLRIHIHLIQERLDKMRFDERVPTEPEQA